MFWGVESHFDDTDVVDEGVSADDSSFDAFRLSLRVSISSYIGSNLITYKLQKMIFIFHWEFGQFRAIPLKYLNLDHAQLQQL